MAYKKKETVGIKEVVDTETTQNETIVEALNAAIGSKADKTEIPSLDGYATEEYIDTKIAELKTIGLG